MSGLVSASVTLRLPDACRSKHHGGVSRIPVPDLGAYLREQREAAQLSLRQLAERAGMSNPYLSQVERGLRRPSAEILSALADALGLSAEALYVRAGILAPPQGPASVLSAVRADPALTERQRRALTDLYLLFVHDATDADPVGSAESDAEEGAGAATGSPPAGRDLPTVPDATAAPEPADPSRERPTLVVAPSPRDTAPEPGRGELPADQPNVVPIHLARDRKETP